MIQEYLNKGNFEDKQLQGCLRVSEAVLGGVK